MSDKCPKCEHYEWFVKICDAIIRSCKPHGMFTKLQNSLKTLNDRLSKVDESD
jgi:hypothetical protein